MRHENRRNDCIRCEEFLKFAHPRMVEWWRLIKPNFSHLHIYCSYRDVKQQNQAYDDGLSRLRFPNSKHNYILDNKPASLAFDLFQLSEEGIALFPFKLYKSVIDLSEQLKQPIRWGGRFRDLGDANHFEWKI
jgi:hypothetical protein